MVIGYMDEARFEGMIAIRECGVNVCVGAIECPLVRLLPLVGGYRFVGLPLYLPLQILSCCLT